MLRAQTIFLVHGVFYLLFSCLYPMFVANVPQNYHKVIFGWFSWYCLRYCKLRMFNCILLIWIFTFCLVSIFRQLFCNSYLKCHSAVSWCQRIKIQTYIVKEIINFNCSLVSHSYKCAHIKFILINNTYTLLNTSILYYKFSWQTKQCCPNTKINAITDSGESELNWVIQYK